MYRFVNLTERGTRSTSLSIQTIFNGINLDELLTDKNGSFTTLTVTGRSNINNRLNTFEVPGRDGLMESNEYTRREKEIVVKYQMSDKTNEGFRVRYNRLNDLLSGIKKALMFTDENYIFYSTLSVNDVPEENSNSLVGTLTFLCADPNKYGPERNGTISNDEGYIDYNGTAETKPTFSFDVLAPITHLDIVGDNGYIRIGDPYTVEETPFEPETIILNDNMSTLTGWGPASSVDGGTVAGQMSVLNGNDFIASDYGSGSSWHGPSVKKSLSQQLQDFKVECYFRQAAYVNPKDTGRVELYLLDINNNVIAKLGLADAWKNMPKNCAEVRLGDTSNNNYMVNTSGETDTWWNNFQGVIRLERIGTKFFAYVANITRDSAGKHFRTWFTGFDDLEEKYQGKVAQVQLHLGCYGTHTAPSQAFQRIKVSKVNQPVTNQVPYIALSGDKIDINFKKSEILINGEERKDLKDFGASFFTFKKGRNNLFILPEGKVSTTVTWREAFK
ncbi:distal tail protein Dit [Rossellomorea sp. DA94]|uniref:distal tail protein Dit n=1 Tax=Rossellomorea sp. DA94 TaxID=3038653 RepID=UPI00244AFA4A|nr:distal tail protein Dit [Rossellomorea sp. DA94]WGG44169.1 phage tail family protein [Rossellomorea sp. DA94]